MIKILSASAFLFLIALLISAISAPAGHIATANEFGAVYPETLYCENALVRSSPYDTIIEICIPLSQWDGGRLAVDTLSYPSK